MHLGPPPLVLPTKRTEDPGGSSEDDGLPHSPPEMLGLPKNTLCKVTGFMHNCLLYCNPLPKTSDPKNIFHLAIVSYFP